MRRLRINPDETPTSITNPALKAFTCTYDNKEYTIAGYGIETYPAYLANHIAFSMADWIIATQGIKKNHALDREKLLDEIYLK